ncbi:MAG: hypothetical protein U5R30_09110 [Deltaproteobacteria bacterium]|nr:hypothetical protein [Deltaproteobacteria bacterium]
MTDDVIASIKTAGLIGDKYIKLSPGCRTDRSKPGGMRDRPESALDIQDLIVANTLFGKG